ncbi:YraN family protein [Methylothermus subterraneus]
MPKSLGRAAEDYALAFLERQGLKLVERNWRCRYGEIDLIFQDRATLVFAEVRCRRSARFGGALESVDKHKQTRLIRAANHYLATHAGDAPVRFDVLALTPTCQGFQVEWIKNAFEAP